MTKCRPFLVYLRPGFERENDTIRQKDKVKFLYNKQETLPIEESYVKASWTEIVLLSLVKILFTFFLASTAYHLVTNNHSFSILSWIFSQSTVLIHESGHVLFTIFFTFPLSLIGLSGVGKFLAVTGGTILQLGFPVLFLIYFFRRRKIFSAWFCLYWLGINFPATARYIADARCICLPAYASVAQGDPNNIASSHDWHIMLSQFGALNNDIQIAKVVSIVGVVIISASLLLMVFDITYKTIKRET